MLLKRVNIVLSVPQYHVVTHRLGSGTGSGCKYRELVSEVRQGAVLNLFLPRMLRTVDFLWREG